MVEAVYAGTIAGPGVTQEQSDRLHAILKPMAEILLGVSPEDLINVMGGLCITFALRYDDPEAAFGYLANGVMERIPEAKAQMTASRN
jgi:hypothetical protein